VLDISLPDVSGLDLQKRVAADRVDMPVIFITGCGVVAMTVQAMKAGAAEFLTKPFDARVLLEAIKQAIDQSRAALEQEAALRELWERYESLSAREREVMALVVTGLLNKQIGSELGISEITVKAHRGRVMRKMEACSLPDLVNLVTRLHLDPPSSSVVSRRFSPASHAPIRTTPKHNCASA
jgi:FixJ family two-component response regulator